ncbi:MAG: ABC transporter ATP-binding protein/permease [Clostridiales bacterium]|jgi:ABC-type bacteriocin/lantibiotic exporter with double-glycine peptidase domain|nr:ABC transporter ATP-binding protein/permease [Clostridiales bacterium]
MSVTIENLSYSYGETLVLSGICLSLATGDHVGIVGVSGGGKTTLLKLVSGLNELQRGIIRVMGCGSSAGRSANVAAVMQSPSLFPASIRDNITCGHVMDEAKLRRVCDAAQLTQWISSLPDGLDSFVGERGAKVSGGQAQRIAIARAMAKDAPVILLDEPTSALDADTAAAVISALDDLTRGKTVLHVSHRPKNLSGCARIYSLEGGCLRVL